MAQGLLEKLEKLDPGQRLLVGLTGIPASGKTSLAHAVVNKVNDVHKQSSPGSLNIAIMIGLDGWHLPRSTLAAMPNSKEAFARRGAHWTFDGEGYVKFVAKLRAPGLVNAPSFSHSAKDPVEDDIQVQSHHRIILLEGLYVFLSIEPWVVAGSMLDERWLVDVDLDDAKERIVKRHVETGVTATEKEATHRAEENDFPNGEFVLGHILEPTRRIKSINDPSIAT